MAGRGRPRGSWKSGNKQYKHDKKGKLGHKEWTLETEKAVLWNLQEKYRTINAASIEKFTDLPLSPQTLKGLQECRFFIPTEIQRETIALSLSGQDVLGAARTGSGKTLAFLIPIIERLFCLQWSGIDGLGALVITPTRELAYQIFETLRMVGHHHNFSAGLIIGGKDLKFERSRMDLCNIIICTPGRLLQHMDENPLFDCNNLKILVLDEADRCLDMGFENAMNAIIENLPSERQTLLFSATQTKSIQDLARLSLNDPLYVAVDEAATPEELQQSYIVCPLEDKLKTLFSFIRSHLRQKIIVFMSSCNQVKYHHDLFKRLRLGPSIIQLQGKLHQLKRMALYNSFCETSNAVLFATDVAARGLDFPAVDWVVHYDCPEDVTTYIHRSGRTARFKQGGESLLMLLPSEEAGMVEELQSKRIPIAMIQTNPEKMFSPIGRIESLLAQNEELKNAAQRAFVAYIKSVFLMKNKKIFNVHALNTEAYSESLGLVVPPRIRFLQKVAKKEEERRELAEKKMLRTKERAKLIEALQTTKKEFGDKSSEEESDDEGQNYNEQDDRDGEDDEDQEGVEDEPHSCNQKELETKQKFQIDTYDSVDSDEDIIAVKRIDHNIDGDDFSDLKTVEERKQAKKKPVSKFAVAKKILRKNLVVNSKILFDNEGDLIVDHKMGKVSQMGKEYDAEEFGGIDIEKAKLAMIEEDKADKQRLRELKKAKRREENRKLKLSRKGADEDDEIQPIDEEVREHVESESEGESDDGPDLSWLPDPDVVYGAKKVDSKEDSEPSDDEEVEEVHRPSPLKRKSKNDGRSELARNKRSREEGQPKDTGLSLMEDEELALQFLKGAG